MKYLSPTLVAEKYGVRVSTAKLMLEELKNENLIEAVAHTSRITVFKPVSAS
jgi:ribosomal protein S25